MLRAVSAALHLILIEYPLEVGSIIIVNLKMRTLRRREVQESTKVVSKSERTLRPRLMSL